MRRIMRNSGIVGIFVLILVAASGVNAEPYWVYFTDKGGQQAGDALKVDEVTASRRLASPLGSVGGFEDLPLHPRYLRMLEVQGALIRARSRWLNAVSIQADSGILPGINTMGFVRALEPVAVHTRPLPDVIIQKREPIEPEHYGDTYTQLELLNIPAVHNLGIFGQGVKVGMLDSGFKRDHTVFRTVRLGAEHDFITGDEIMLWTASGDDAVSVLSNYEIVRKPRRHGDWITFIADSTDRNAPTVRLLYASAYQDGAWQDPVPVSSASHVCRSYAAVDMDSTHLLVWESGRQGNLQDRDLYACMLTPSGIADKSDQIDFSSRNPYLVSLNDTSTLLFYVKNEGSVYARRMWVSQEGIGWDSGVQVFGSGGIFDTPRAVVWGDTLLVAGLDLTTGRMRLARSLDEGASFSGLSSPTSDEVAAFDLAGGLLAAAVLEEPTGGFRLAFYQSSDNGSSWLQYLHPQVYPSIGEVDVEILAGGGVHCIFETAGQVLYTSSPGALDSWTQPETLAADFSYQPGFCPYEGELYAVWALSGDGNTDFDSSEDYYDVNGRSQPSHGSRVAALMIGYQGRSYIGACPGAQLYVAKTEKHINRFGTRYELRVEEDMWVQGLEWLEREGVDIVNSSLAYGDFYNNEEADGLTSPASRAASMAARRGVLVTNAAGNVTTGDPYVMPPADAYDILTVGGTDTLGNWWEPTSEDAGSAVGLPNDGRVKPELVAPAKGVYVVDVDDTAGLSYYFYGQGTSYAAPLTAGIAALMLEVHPEYRGKPETMIEILTQTGSTYTSPNGTLGYGIPDAFQAILPLPPEIDTFSQNQLLAAFPNPFNPSVHQRIYFPFRLIKASPRVFLRIFTLSGEKVLQKQLVPLESTGEVDEIPIGTYQQPDELSQIGAFWDGQGADGQPSGSGLYLVVLSTQFGSHTSKFVVVR